MRTLEQRIVDAASDYKMATENEGFADFIGGIECARDDLFDLVGEWEGCLTDDELDDEAEQ